MPRWVLTCPECGKEFTHSNIERTSMADFYLDPKPQFPSDGSKIECPNCKNSSVYQHFDLAYRAN